MRIPTNSQADGMELCQATAARLGQCGLPGFALSALRVAVTGRLPLQIFEHAAGAAADDLQTCSDRGWWIL